jgi:hypothetical protein
VTRSPALALAAVLFAIGSLSAQSSAASPSVTLFNSGRVLVRRTLPIALPAGVSTQTVALGTFVASSFQPLDAGVSLVRLNVDLAWSEDALLRRNIGHIFYFDSPDKPRRGAVLLSLDPERWEWGDGGRGVVFGRPGKITWPKEIIPNARVADVTLESERARDGVRVMYSTDGARWSVNYRAFLGAAGRFEGLATISAGTLDLADAEVQLLAGNIGNNSRGVEGGIAMGSGGGRGGAALTADSYFASQESLGDAHLYTLPGRLSFVSGTQTVGPILEPVAAKAERRFTVSGGLPYYGTLSQNDNEQIVPVSVAYLFARKHGTAFGDLPLPAGTIDLFDLDKGGRMQLVGQGRLDHTAAGQDLLVESGTAFDITARRVQVDYTSTQAGKPLRTTAIGSYRVTIQNAKDSAVVVDVREDRSGVWSILESSVPAVKKSATRVVFSVPVAAKDSTVLTYRVRTVW